MSTVTSVDTGVVGDTLESSNLSELERRFRENQLRMDIQSQEAQMKTLGRALALAAADRSFGSAGPQEVMEGLYAPEDYVDISDYRRDNYGYQSMAATFTTKTDRQDGRNWPYWVSEPELAAIRGTVRLLSNYNKTCFGILNKLRNYVVSTGFTRKVINKREAPQTLIQAAEYILDEFDSVNRITGDLDQECVIRSIRDGEVPLGLWHRGEGYIDLRTVEPDQISEPTNKTDLEEWLREQGQEEAGLPFASNWSFGIHTTKGDVQERHGYYVQWDGDPQNWDYMPGGNKPCYPPCSGDSTWLEMMKCNTDRSIKRGVSDFWAITGDVELARKMIRNLSHAGALQAAIAWIREMSPGVTQSQVASSVMSAADWQTNTAKQNGGTRTTYQQTYNPGTTLYLGANQKFVPPPWVQQSMASGLVQIYESMLRSIAQIWSMPEHMITGNAGNNNYASILEAGSPFVKEVETRQKSHCDMWTAIYWKVLYFNWKCGRLGSYSWQDVRKAIEVKLTGPQIDVRNRLEETKKNVALMDAGVMSPTEVASREGIDYQEQLKQGAKSKDGLRSEFDEMKNKVNETIIKTAELEQALISATETLSAPTDTAIEPAVSTEPVAEPSAPAEDVQATAFNGAQVTAATAIAAAVTRGEIPYSAGLGQLMFLFNLNEEQAKSMLGDPAEIAQIQEARRASVEPKQETRNVTESFNKLSKACGCNWSKYP